MSNEIQFLLYSLPDEEGKVQVVIKDETIWCTQKAMAQLFGVQRPAITKHLGNIFKDGELDEKVVCSILELTTEHGAIEGKTQTSPTKFYNLDAIIAVGYRVSSLKATRFRQWSTKILNEYIKKGFVMDDERLKQGKAIFVDYDKNAPTTREFYAMIQNRFHYAITGQTAGEIIYTKAESEYDIFNKTQHIDSDFDKQIRGMLGDKK